MAYIRFASIAHSAKYGYSFDSGEYGDTRTCSYFRQFETYGDGLTPHSGNWSVTPEFLTDYLASLAKAMLADDELARAARFSLFRGDTTKEQLEFAAGIKYRESDSQFDKQRYFSVQLSKVSSSQSKRHDKRFLEVSRWHDGEPASVFRIVTPEYADGFTKFQIADKVRDYFNEKRGYGHMEHAAIFLGWTTDEHKARMMRSALDACRNVVDALHKRENAQCFIETTYGHSVKVQETESAA